MGCCHLHCGKPIPICSDYPDERWSLANRVSAHRAILRRQPLDFPCRTGPLDTGLGCLGWAIRGGEGPKLRWASSGLLALAAFGVFSVSWALFHLPAGQHWLWVSSLHAFERSHMGRRARGYESTAIVPQTIRVA